MAAVDHRVSLSRRLDFHDRNVLQTRPRHRRPGLHTRDLLKPSARARVKRSLDKYVAVVERIAARCGRRNADRIRRDVATPVFGRREQLVLLVVEVRVPDHPHTSVMPYARLRGGQFVDAAVYMAHGHRVRARRDGRGESWDVSSLPDPSPLSRVRQLTTRMAAPRSKARRRTVMTVSNGNVWVHPIRTARVSMPLLQNTGPLRVRDRPGSKGMKNQRRLVTPVAATAHCRRHLHCDTSGHRQRLQLRTTTKHKAGGHICDRLLRNSLRCNKLPGRDSNPRQGD